MKAAIALCIVAAASARADADAKQEAAAHVEAASTAHAAGNFGVARGELIAAYALDPQPDLLFALGQVHVKLNACGVAIRLYERFLASSPPAGPAAAATEAIAVCRAKPSPVPAPDHLERATTLHRDGKYTEALPELMFAYALDDKPDLLFAIGQVEVKLGHCPRAVLFYERFVATSPAAGPAAAATEAIETCRTNPPPAAAPPRTVAVATRSAWYADPIGDALAAGGLGLAIGAAFAYSSALSNLDAAERTSSYDAHAAAVDRAHDRRTLAVALGAGGVALGTLAVVRFLRADRRREETRTVTVAPTSGGAAVILGGRW
jgi:tetratricopeptide (TPR) repeat protein